MKQQPTDTAHTPKPKTVDATKRTNDDQRMKEIEREQTRQRQGDK